MKDEVGGWLKSFQPHLLTVVVATLQSKLGRDRKPGGWGCPTLSEGAPGGAEGAGGRDECNIGRGKNNTAPRPVPPAHPGLWNPAPYLLGRWSPGTGVLWGVWVTLEVHQSLDTQESEVARGKG